MQFDGEVAGGVGAGIAEPVWLAGGVEDGIARAGGMAIDLQSAGQGEQEHVMRVAVGRVAGAEGEGGEVDMEVAQEGGGAFEDERGAPAGAGGFGGGRVDAPGGGGGGGRGRGAGLAT